MRFGRARSGSTADAAKHAKKINLRLCVLCIVCVQAALTACGGGLFRQYEYEEDIYLSLDGTATVYVNSSLAALNALRGTSFDLGPAARVDRDGIRSFYTSPTTHVTWVRQSRRSGRRFVHVRLDVDDVRRLAAVAPFSWSTYTFRRDANEYVFQQVVGAAAGKDVGAQNWSGRELVAFRLHLPSKITYHPKEIDIRRGNILVWEQPLADRLRGVPLTLDARMETQSILYRTLWLFGATFIAVALTFVVVIWWVLRRGAEAPQPTP